VVATGKGERPGGASYTQQLAPDSRNDLSAICRRWSPGRRAVDAHCRHGVHAAQFASSAFDRVATRSARGGAQRDDVRFVNEMIALRFTPGSTGRAIEFV